MIPVEPDWSAVIYELRRRGLRDKDMLDKMADQGFVAYAGAIWELRTKNVTNPSYALGAALLNLLEVKK